MVTAVTGSSVATAILSWRIPTTGDPRRLRLALAQVGLATIVAALVLLVAAPREWLVPALVGLIPLAVLVAYRRWRRFQQALIGPANVWIDAAGVHWFDAADREQQFARAALTGFRVGIEEDTLRAVPALTLHLAGGFESQPLELYPPATPEAIRQVLAQAWGLAEQAPPMDQRTYDHAAQVYSECHEEVCAWHWEGTRASLTEFFALAAQAAAELPAPPPGARPAQGVIRCSRREPTVVRLARAPLARLDHDLFAAPAETIAEFAAKGTDIVAAAATPSDPTFEIRLPNDEIWTFHLHVRDP